MKPTTNPDDWRDMLTVGQFSNASGLQISTVRRLVDIGAIAARRRVVHGYASRFHWRIPRSELSKVSIEEATTNPNQQ